MLDEVGKMAEAAEARIARIAVCGAGWWSQGWHLPHLSRRPDAHIVAIVEPMAFPRSAIKELEPLAALGERYGAPTFSSVDELFESGVEVDGLLVCTTHASHYEIGVRGLRAGCHVLMEKPMTVDVAEARLLAAEARGSARTFMVNNTANWRSQCRLAAEAVASRALGDIVHVACMMHSPLMWLFDDPANTGWTQPCGGMSGNGFGWGQLSHLLAWVFKVTQLRPVEAYAAMGRSGRSGADLTDAAVLRCAGGASIALSGAASVPGDAHSDCPVGKYVSVRIFGSAGMLTYEGDDQSPASGALVLARMGGSREVLADEFHFENYDNSEGSTGPESLHAFVAASRGRDVFVGVSATEGLRVVCTLDAMYRSAKSGRAEPAVEE